MGVPLRQAIQQVADMKRRLAEEIKAAEQKTIEFAHDVAIDLSSGPFSTKELRKMGHPYAVRNPRPPADAAIINTQTGTFRASWRSVLRDWEQGRLRTSLLNTDDKAVFLNTHSETHKNSSMIIRPIRRRIISRVNEVRIRNLEEAIQRALT